jgi:hypothetical protein
MERPAHPPKPCDRGQALGNGNSTSGGLGAEMGGDFNLTMGEVLDIYGEGRAKTSGEAEAAVLSS